MNILNATKRSKADKLATIRNNGMVPGVVYGARVENTMISVSSVDFLKIFKNVGETGTIGLEIKGENKSLITKIDVLVHDLQVDPIKGFPIHIDFLAIDINKPVEVAIQLEFTGIAKAEKDGLGTLVKVLHEVTVIALPKDLPHTLQVDVTKINTLEDKITVGDINIPKNVKIITDNDEIVALVREVKEEKEEVPVDLSSIEVEKKGKIEKIEE